LRLLATTGAALVLVVIVSSAYLRLSQAGLSCVDWPACYGNVTHGADATTAQRGARLAHRFAATAVALALVALLTLALMQRPRLRKQAVLAGAALVIASVLAMIGAVSSESASITPLPAVTLANLAGGFALLAVLCWLRQTVMPAVRAGASHRLRILAVLTLSAVIAQATLGGLVSAKFAALACPAFPLCGAEAPAGGLLQSLDPFATLDVDSSRSIVRPPALAALHWTHRVGAHVVLVLIAILSVALARAGRRSAALALALLVVVELALGASSVLAELPLGVVLAHNLVAALLLTALVTINYRLRADTR
jgi:cytochrome c oxidase assembly protein subunit 15